MSVHRSFSYFQVLILTLILLTPLSHVSASPSFHVVAKTGDPATPIVPGPTFDYFQVPGMNSDGGVAFSAIVFHRRTR